MYKYDLGNVQIRRRECKKEYDGNVRQDLQHTKPTRRIIKGNVTFAGPLLK